MAEYYVVANMDKKQYLAPGDLGDGAKLVEFAARERGPTVLALALLLAKRPRLPRGTLLGGRSGSWYGDRIAMVGSYEESPPGREENLYDEVIRSYENISKETLETVRTYLAAMTSPHSPE